MRKLVSIVELTTFVRTSHDLLTDGEKEDLKLHLATNPEAGDVIKGTGGVRKLRWAAQGKGKRGGGRVIYYFHDLDMPLFLITFYTKSARSDLSGKGRHDMSRLVAALRIEYGRGGNS